MIFSSNNKDSSPKKQQENPESSEEVTRRNMKIMERLNKAVDNYDPLQKNRSAELVPLKTEFDHMKHKLRALLSSVKKYQLRTQDMNDAKLELSEQLAALSTKSPIYDEIGNDVDEETSKALEKLTERSAPHSSGHITSTEEVTKTKGEYRARQESGDSLSLYGLYRFGAAQSIANDNEFQVHIVDYVQDWERIVNERVESDMKKVKELESNKRHYDEKVEGLREKVGHKEEKGKELSKGEVEKLDRNEDKLKEAFSTYEQEASKLCCLLENITRDGYKDLYPLVKNYMKWEMNRIGREHDIAERLSDIMDSLNEKVGSKNTPNLEVKSVNEESKEPVSSQAEQ